MTQTQTAATAPAPPSARPAHDRRRLALLAAAGAAAAIPLVTCGAALAWILRSGQPAQGAAEAGLAAIGAAGAIAAVLVAWRTARLLRPLLEIHSALGALSRGEPSLEALTISPRWGPEAATWNSFLAKRQEEQIAVQERSLGQIGPGGRSGDGLLDRSCDALPQGLLVIDSAGKVRYANGAAGILLGVKRPELVGRPVRELVPHAPVREMVSAVAEQGTRRRGVVEVELSPADAASGGEPTVLRFTCCRAGAASDPAGVSALLVEDVTQQRVADRARDLFVSQATHELRTPLTNIRLYVETLLESGGDDPAARGQALNVINQESRRLERMVGDMLSVAEIEAGSMKLHTDDVRLEALLPELKADFLAQASEKGITLVFDLPPKLPVIRGDRDKITMSLHNLIGNALKYTPKGGTVTVTVQETAGTIAFRVSDTGIGIAPDEAEQVFEKFYRSKDRRVAKIPGTGLGLAIAREVARLHGGDITLESKVDHGSTFTLTIPHLAQAA